MAVTAAVKGGSADIWGATLTLQRGVSVEAKRIARMLNERSMRKDRQLINVLLGAVAGTTATATLRRVQAVGSTEQGGKRTTEAENLVNRASTAQDDTDLTVRYLTYASRPTYPVDKASRW